MSQLSPALQATGCCADGQWQALLAPANSSQVCPTRQAANPRSPLVSIKLVELMEAAALLAKALHNAVHLRQEWVGQRGYCWTQARVTVRLGRPASRCMQRGTLPSSSTAATPTPQHTLQSTRINSKNTTTAAAHQQSRRL